MTDEPHLRQLIAARHLYFLSDEQIRSEQDVAHFAGVNLLHDAVEMALWTAASAINATRSERSELIQLFDGVNEKIGKGLPFRGPLIQLNKLRINAKHYGVRPDIGELRRLQSQMLEVISEIARAVFGANFETMSLFDLLPTDRASTSFLIAANDDFMRGDFRAALVGASKAFFLEFLQNYDVRQWRSEETEPGFFGILGNQAPQWAKNPKYIEENVHDPIDFIVIDHSDLDRNIVRMGLDYNVFWNIWRLTPRVYRPAAEQGAPWVIREDATVDENIKGQAEYVLHHLTEILLQVERERQKSKVRQGVYAGLVLAKQGIVLRRKAAAHSARLEEIPNGVDKVNADYQVDSLDGSGKYWHVVDLLPEPSLRFIIGYLHESDVAGVESEVVRFPRGATQQLPKLPTIGEKS